MARVFEGDLGDPQINGAPPTANLPQHRRILAIGNRFGIHHRHQPVFDGKRAEEVASRVVVPDEVLLEVLFHADVVLLEVLQDLQEAEGFISEDAMNAVSGELGVPLIEVYRAASFYKAFSLTPRGKHVVTICMGTACHVRGAPRILDEFSRQLDVQPGETSEDRSFTLETVNCVGACALGPIAIADGEYHGQLKSSAIEKIIESLKTDEKD